MRSVPLCGQTELSWGENLSIIPVKKTGCTAHWAGSEDSRGNTALRSHGGRWAYTKRLNIELGRKIAGAIVKKCRREPCRCDRIRVSGNAGKDIRKEKNRNCICGENGISRNAVSIRHTEKECGYPESAHGIRAGLHTMAPEVCPVT